MLHSCAIGQRIDTILFLSYLITVSVSRTYKYVCPMAGTCEPFEWFLLCGLWIKKTMERTSYAQSSTSFEFHSVIRCWNIAIDRTLLWKKTYPGTYHFHFTICHRSLHMYKNIHPHIQQRFIDYFGYLSLPFYYLKPLSVFI